jgi:hypothetical protein
MMAIKKKSAHTKKQAKKTQPHSADLVLQLETQIKTLQSALTSAHEKAISEANKQLDRYKLQFGKTHQKLLAQKEKRTSLAQKAKSKKTAATLQQLKKADETLKTLQTETRHLKDAMTQTRQSLATQQQALNKTQAIQKLVLTLEKKWAKAERKTEKSALKKNKAKSKTKASKTALTTERPSPKSSVPEKSKLNENKKKSTQTSVKTIKTSDKTKTQNTLKTNMSDKKEHLAPAKTKASEKKTTTSRTIKTSAEVTQKKAEKTSTLVKKPAVKNKKQAPATDARIDQLQQTLPLTPSAKEEAVIIPAPTIQKDQTTPAEAQTPSVNPAETQLSEPGRSIFDPAKDMK